jgi:hypothetical protein
MEGLISSVSPPSLLSSPLLKNLADISEKLENWKGYAEASLQLYSITKE